MDFRIEVIFLVQLILVFCPCMECTPVRNVTREDPTTSNPSTSQQTMSIGPCKWILNRPCPDDDIKFYLFTRQNMMDRQNLKIDSSLENSNISDSFFNPLHPTKIIIHGYNSDMFLNSLINMKDEYLQKGEYNLIYVDWSVLSPGPCYFSAVHNTRHVGVCSAQLVERILDTGSADIHVIGFSLGAQLANFLSRSLGSFLLPRITGLDPAMPLFITSSTDEKLDPSDAAFVDVIHTNALVQGKLERCGHVDFYMNGGIFQPGCSGNIFACSHQRAPSYFMESIRSLKGFWGWACSSYIAYLLGMCPPTNYLVEAGENCNPSMKGLYLISTGDISPFALGKWTDLPGEIKDDYTFAPKPLTRHSPLMKEVDEWGKLDGHFNNIMNFPTPFSQDPNGETWPYFGKSGTKEITHELKEHNNVERLRSSVTPATRRNVRPGGNSKFRRKDNRIDQGTSSMFPAYKANLTMGFIDKSVFQVPKLSYN